VNYRQKDDSVIFYNLFICRKRIARRERERKREREREERERERER